MGNSLESYFPNPLTPEERDALYIGSSVPVSQIQMLPIDALFNIININFSLLFIYQLYISLKHCRGYTEQVALKSAGNYNQQSRAQDTLLENLMCVH